MIAPAMVDLPELMTEAEAAQYLGLKPHTLAVWRCTGRVQLPYVKVGHLVRYRRADVHAYVCTFTQIPRFRVGE